MGKHLKNHRVFVTVVFVAFIVLESLSVLNHEPWRDEMAVWMVAKYNSLDGILDEAKVQAQPALWYFVVKAVQKVMPQPIGMGFANLVLIGLAVLLLLIYAPFSRTEKVLLCFSYFIFYEYGTISRNYGMSILVVFAICALYSRRDKYLVLIAILLAVSCSIQIMNSIFAVCFASLLTAERLLNRASATVGRAGNRYLLIANLIIGAGILLAFCQATPPEGSPWSLASGQKWVFQSAIGALKSVWMSFVPLASPNVHFWNTNILPDSRLMAILSFVLLALSIGFLKSKPLITVFYLMGIVSLLTFFYKFYHGFTRHHGYLFLMFVTSCWIYGNFEGQQNEVKRRTNEAAIGRRFDYFTLICLLNFCAVFVPLYFDWKYPFSASRDVGRYLINNKMNDCILFGDVDSCVAPVAGWIDREMYYPMSGQFSKIVVWNSPQRRHVLSEETRDSKSYKQKVWQTAINLAKEKGQDVVLVLNYPLDEKPLKEFRVSIVTDESYYLYRVTNQFIGKQTL